MKKLNHFSSNSLVLAVSVFLSRLKVFPANVSPLGSFGFFSQSPWLYILSIVLFDYFIGGFYTGFLWTYLAFLAYPAIGFFARKRSIKHQALLLPGASVMFFVISNFGVWLNWYPMTWSGLLTCYTLALPFFARTLIGDLFFGYGYLVFQSNIPIKVWKQLLQSVTVIQNQLVHLSK